MVYMGVAGGGCVQEETGDIQESIGKSVLRVYPGTMKVREVSRYGWLPGRVPDGYLVARYAVAHGPATNMPTTNIQ